MKMMKSALLSGAASLIAVAGGVTLPYRGEAATKPILERGRWMRCIATPWRQPCNPSANVEF